MKKCFLLCLLGALFVLPSCSNNEPDSSDYILWDFRCYDVRFYVKDKATGLNLLDPENPDNILDQKISIEYNGKAYDMWPYDGEYYEGDHLVKARAIAPRPLSLLYLEKAICYDYDRREYKEVEAKYMVFGGFTPCDDHHNQPFTLKFENGEEINFSFDCFITWKSKTEPKVTVDLKQEGEEVDFTAVVVEI